MKQIGVIGLGQFGAHLAVCLTDRGCQVVAIDRSETNVALVRDKVDRAIILDARDYAALSSVVTPELDEVVVSLGESMEASILCTLHLRKIGIPMIRAKAVSEDHAAILRSVGANEVIYPERETAERVAAQIANPNLLDFIPLAPEYQVVEIVAPPQFAGKSLVELDLRRRFNVFVIAVRRGVQQTFVFMPDPGFVFGPDDVLVAIGQRQDIDRLTAG